MAESKTTWGNRALAGFGALALATAGLLGGSTAAFADTPTLGNIDQGAKGSILIHKHEHQVGEPVKQDPKGTGTAIPSKPVGDVEFKAWKIPGIDLSKTEDWTKVKDLKPNPDCSLDGVELGAPVAVKTTTAAGTATMAGLDVAAYLVCETAAPEIVVDRALPFIVTIPLPFEKSWVYDVNVYPKNGVTGIEKSIENQQGLGLGSVVKFPVTTDVPSLAKGEKLKSYSIVDTLDNRLTPGGVESITVAGVAVDKKFYDVTTAGQKIAVTFTGDGLEWLKSQGNKKIVTVFQGAVNAVGDGAIENTAVVYANDPSNTKGVSSNEVTTNWGDVRILKTNDATNAKALEGAEFEVYAAVAPYAETCDAAVATGEKLTTAGNSLFVSDGQGEITLAGLFVSDSVNEAVNADQRCYVLKETKAPAGFITPAGNAAFTPIAVKKGATVTTGYDVTIVNTQQGVPELPLTGANGQMLMIIGGSAVLLISAGLVMVNRRRAAAQRNG